jgi:hypothetical protein
MGDFGGGGGGGGGGSKVLCTYFYNKGWMAESIYAADVAYADAHVSEDMKNGYHKWAVPLVQWLQEKERPVIEKLLFIGVNGWAHQMAYEMGISDKRSVIGTVIKVVGEPLCTLIGKFVGQSDYKSLWTGFKLPDINQA